MCFYVYQETHIKIQSVVRRDLEQDFIIIDTGQIFIRNFP